MRILATVVVSLVIACGGSSSSGEACGVDGEMRCASSTTIEVCTGGQWRPDVCPVTDAGVVSFCEATLKGARCVSFP